MFGRLYCRHVTEVSAAAEGGAAGLFLEVCGRYRLSQTAASTINK